MANDANSPLARLASLAERAGKEDLRGPGLVSQVISTFTAEKAQRRSGSYSNQGMPALAYSVGTAYTSTSIDAKVESYIGTLLYQHDNKKTFTDHWLLAAVCLLFYSEENLNPLQLKLFLSSSTFKSDELQKIITYAQQIEAYDNSQATNNPTVCNFLNRGMAVLTTLQAHSTQRKGKVSPSTFRNCLLPFLCANSKAFTSEVFARLVIALLAAGEPITGDCKTVVEILIDRMGDGCLFYFKELAMHPQKFTQVPDPSFLSKNMDLKPHNVIELLRIWAKFGLDALGGKDLNNIKLYLHLVGGMLPKPAFFTT